MSQKYPGGIISKTAPVPTGPYENGTAPGVWTLEQQAEFVKQGIWPIAGNVPNFIEDVFSTYLYTGNGTGQTITNGIDLAGEGGLVWIKDRSQAASHNLFDTVRGVGNRLRSNATDAQASVSDSLLSFNASGFSIGQLGSLDDLGNPLVSWTFRKQPKFFDIQTFTATGFSLRTINHNLESTPGCVIIKRTITNGSPDSTSDAWYVWHRSLSSTQSLFLNTTAAANNDGYFESVTSTQVQWYSNQSSGVTSTYVMYVFAHDAGGFGLTGTDNVISCGSYAGNGGANNNVTLGYEPQWVILKRTNGTSSWAMFDTMRGIATGGNDPRVQADQADAELDSQNILAATATGFQLEADSAWNISGSTYIYIAIRRGPMKVPTTGTSVFAPVLGDATSIPNIITNFPVDFGILKAKTGSSGFSSSRLTQGQRLIIDSTAAQNEDDGYSFAYQNGWFGRTLSSSFISWAFRRAPGFFDEVCYTGNSTARTIAHNLTVAPELIILKSRSTTRNWVVYPNSPSQYLYLNAADPSNSGGSPWWNDTAPTSSVFSLGTGFQGNETGASYVAYLFATCPGVSKVGNYTGTGTTQVINCGFTGGARFVLIKQTSGDGGDWYVWDSARGIVAGNDPYLELNTTDAEVTNTDWVDTAATGFELSNAGGNLANSNGVSYIFLCIA
jgi:hypothetical protein